MDRLEMWLKAHPKVPKPEGGERVQKHYDCRKCYDTGVIIFVQDGYTVMRNCSCYEVKRAKELMEKSGLSEEFLKKSFDSFDTKKEPVLIDAKNKAVNYVKNFKKNRHSRHNSIMFGGQPGCGKTHLGTAICSSLMDMGIPVIYMPYRNTMTKIKQHILDETVYSSELGRYMDAPVLYIDDLLKGKLTETDVNVMYELINYRYMNNLPLIISTEKDLEGLLVFDEAIGSRIIEMCKDNIALIKGKKFNYRMSKLAGI
ncbi:MAG: ATP-binding protein [Lachnospiraceae bacterium]|nr:ATP-binding protein [Lachnospiraceae bacterium]